MTKRLLAGLIATTAALWVAHAAYGGRAPEWRMAQQMGGEYWYRLSLDEQHIGYLSSRNAVTAQGELHLSSDLRFAMTDDAPVHIEQSLVFAASAPHSLQRAVYRIERPDSRVNVRALADAADPEQFHIEIDGSDEQQSRTARWRYALADYLKVESWLASEQPADGARIRSESLDLEKLRLTSRQFEVVARSSCCFSLRNSALHAATEIELDANFVPRRMHLAGLFQLDRSDRETALAPRSVLTQASFHVPLNRRLQPARGLERLTLAPQGPDKSLWPERLNLRSNPVSDARTPGRALTDSTLTHPADHPRLVALLDTLRLPEDPRLRVEHLREFVHGFLRYEPRGNPATVLSLLQTPVGDCSEFADLFTTLARAADLPTRTVFGLAYNDVAEPALGFHAWNEVYVDGSWETVDPTWNQQPVDATHLLLPTDDAAALRLLTGNSRLSFDVIDSLHATTASR